MSNRLRDLAPGGVYHITQRGNNRVPVFCTDPDRRTWLRYLELYSRETGCPIHAYCLMGNHVHLVLTAPGTDAVANLMSRLQGRYARHFNRTWHCSGSLWAKRYHHVLVESDSHLLSCLMYIDRNPVDARLCRSADQYPWSSHRVYALGLRDPLVTPHPGYLALGDTESGRCRAYLQAFAEALNTRPAGTRIV